DDAHVGLRHRLIVALAELRIEIGERVELRLGDRKDVDDVTRVPCADLDADRIGKHEMRKPGRRLDRNLCRDPGAERYPDNDRVLEVEVIEQIEVEIGEVVDGGERLRLLGVAEARMARCDHACMPGKLVDGGGVAIEPDAGMEEQKRPTASFFDGLNLDAVDRYGGR